MSKKTAGQRLREWRLSNGYGVAELGSLLGVHKNHICAMQSGRRKPGRRVAALIEELTGIEWQLWDR